jgi:DNA replication protein DnaC
MPRKADKPRELATLLKQVDSTRIDKVAKETGYEEAEDDILSIAKEFTGNYAPDPTCPDCKGMGMYRNNPGQQIPKYEVCGCYIQAKRNMSRSDMAMKSRGIHTHLTFEKFNDKIAGVKRSYDAAKSWARAEFQNLLIFGTTGNGKTHLLHAAGYYLSQHDEVPQIFLIPSWLSYMKSLIKQDEYEVLLEHAKTIRFLLLDDYKTRTTFESDLLEEILVQRHDDGLFTFMTTNMDIKDMIDTSPRVASRFEDKQFSKVIFNEANDYRVSKARLPYKD